MGNELLSICSLLNGYTENRYTVIKACKNENGLWDLTIKKIEAQKATEEENGGEHENN